MLVPRRVWGLAVAALLGAGCASAPDTQYYTLDLTRAADANPPVNIAIDHLRPTEALARSNLLVRTSPTQIEYFADDHWAAGLAQIVEEKLEAEFGPAREERPTVLLFGEIEAFGLDESGATPQAHAKLDLAVRREDSRRYDEPLWEHTYETRLEAGAGDADAAARALSRALETIAANLSADLAKMEWNQKQ